MSSLLPLVFLSGAAGLIAEVVFTRRLVQIFGSTSEAVATVLAAFMAGFALGAWLWGRRADRARRPERIYAALEVLIGASSLLIFALLPLLHPYFEAVYELSSRNPAVYTATRFLVLFGLLVIPTTCMGATLPVLARAAGGEQGMGRVVGLLYAVNTAGAVAGTLLAGFVLIEVLGLTRTLLFASALNGTAALGVVVLLRRVVASPAEPETGPEGAPPPHLGAALVGTFVCGFAALGFEVVWTRMLILYITGTTYAFSTMLATFLVGIALGSYLFGRRADLERRTLLVFAAAQGLAGVLACAVVPILSSFPQGRVYPRPEGPTWVSIVLTQFGEAFAVMLLPTLLVGGTFPLACRLASRGVGRSGRDVGRVYGANTCGAILGSLAAGFVLVPTLGLHGANRLLAGLLVLSSAWLVLRQSRTDAGVRRATALVPIVAFVAVLGLAGRRERLIDLDPGERLRFYDEGRAATVAVVERPSGERRLLIDNIFVAGSHPVMLTDQKSIAHFPCLLHPRPRRVLTVGFGSGGASYSFCLYREVERVDCVEIVPEVLKAAVTFPDVNHGVLTNEKLHVVLDDARSYLSLAGREKYDVIASDCTDLSYRANADLYQRDFFEMCRRQLNPGGIMCVWLPLRHLSREDFATALGSFHAVFPHGTLWYMLNMPCHYVLLIGTDAPLRVDIEQLAERLSRPEIAADLAEIGLGSPTRIASCLMLDERAMAEVTRDAVPHTEDHPRLEFTVPRYPRGREREYENLEEMLPLRAKLADVLPDLAAASPVFVALEDAVAQALTRGHIEVLKFHDRMSFRYYSLALEASPQAADVRALLLSRRARLEGYADLADAQPERLFERAELDLLDEHYDDAHAAYLAVAKAGIEPAESYLGAAVSARSPESEAELLARALASDPTPLVRQIVLALQAQLAGQR